MIISIGCVDGNTYTSDHVFDSHMNEYLVSIGGRIGTGSERNTRVYDVEGLREVMLGYCEYKSKNDSQVLTINMDGVERRFNVKHIVWAEIRLDKDNK